MLVSRRDKCIYSSVCSKHENLLCTLIERFTILERINDDAGVDQDSHILFLRSSCASSNVISAGMTPKSDRAMSTLS